MNLRRVWYFGAGSLHNLDSSVDGTKHIRLPIMRCLNAVGTRVSWIGFTRENNIKNHYLDLIGLKQEKFVDDVRNFVSDDASSIYSRETGALTYGVENIIRMNPGILFVELRPNDDKPGYEFLKEFNIQISLIRLFVDIGLPVVVYDEDCWANDIPMDLRDKIILFKSYFSDAHESFTRQHTWLFGWFVPEFEKELLSLQEEKRFDIVYCGNVYGRRDDFLSYMSPFHDADKRVCVQGNWLRKKYDDRDFSLDNFQKFMFFGQTPHWSTLPSIALAKSVIHFSNPEQQSFGLPTARIFETLMGKSVVFCSDKIMGIDRLIPDELIVSSPDDLIERWKKADRQSSWKYLRELFEKKLMVRDHSYFHRIETLQKIVIDEFGCNDRWVTK